MWYHILSIPRTISHLEIKLELPCPQDTWTASTSSNWAHRSLTSAKPADQGPSRYIQAVRTCMSPSPSICLPKYDAHGALLIILFMLSSVREQSGWSTMTGRVSFERFEVSTLDLELCRLLIVGPAHFTQGIRRHHEPFTSRRADVSRMRSDLAHVHDRASPLVHAPHERGRRRIPGRCSGCWVSEHVRSTQ